MYPAVLSFSSMMNSLMDTIASASIGKIISYVFWSTQGLFLSYVYEIVSNALNLIFIWMLDLVWLLEQAFDAFSGTQPVYVSDSAGNVVGQMDFMSAVLTGSQVQNAYWAMMIGATVLCFFFTILAVIKSMGESLSQIKRPVSAVIRQAFQAVLSFVMVPTACLAVVKVGAAITKIITTVGDETGDQRICDIVFVLTVGDEWKSEAARKICSSGRMFSKLSSRKYYNWRDINYFYAYIMAIFMLVVMITIVMQAVMRAVMLAVLFLASPWFVSAIPIDGGEKFKSWTRIFAGFAFATFGPLLVMRSYTVLLQAIGVTGNISFGTEFNPITGWFLKLAITAFGMVGAWQSQYIILDIFSPETSTLLKQSQFLAKMGGDAAKRGISAAATYLTGGASKVGEIAGQALGGMGQGKDQ